MENEYINDEVAKMDCATVRAELETMAAKLNKGEGNDTYSDNYIADLRNRSRVLGCKLSINWNAETGKQEVGE